MTRKKVGGLKFNEIIIRFKRKAGSFFPFYDIVVIKKATREKGAFIEKLGFFNPSFFENCFIMDLSRLGYWLNFGAKLHVTVKKRLVKYLS